MGGRGTKSEHDRRREGAREKSGAGEEEYPRIRVAVYDVVAHAAQEQLRAHAQVLLAQRCAVLVGGLLTPSHDARGHAAVVHLQKRRVRRWKRLEYENETSCTLAAVAAAAEE